MEGEKYEELLHHSGQSALGANQALGLVFVECPLAMKKSRQDAKAMLEMLLTQGQLSGSEKQVFEDMWDQVHRTRLSPKQLAWVESVYYKQHLEKAMERPAKKRVPKVLFLREEGVKRTVAASNTTQFEVLCPHHVRGSKVWKQVDTFFLNGGLRFELRPLGMEERSVES